MEMRLRRSSWFDWLNYNRPNVRWASLNESSHSIQYKKENTVMAHGILRTCVTLGVLSYCLTGMNLVAQAGIVVDASVGGAPTGANYANFDGLPPGAAGGVSNGITVSFTGDGQTVQGSQSDVYAAPYLSNGNGTLFGDPNNGPDATNYLSTGVGSVTLALPGQETYLGLLWGSVDTYNTLSLYNGSTFVGTVTGTDVTASASGNQGELGTFYVNITSTDSFDRVVATSSSYAFEFDNVAYNVSAVPEPSSLLLGGIAALGSLGVWARRRRA